MTQQPVRTVDGMHPQTAMQLGMLLRRVSGSNKTDKQGRTLRQRQLELLAEYDPNYRLPGDVQIAQLKNEIKAERAQEKAAENKERAENRRANGRKKMVDQYSEEIVKAIEAGPLKKYPDLSWEDAAKIYASENRDLVTPNGIAPERPGRHRQYWELPIPDGTTAEAFLKDPDKISSDIAYSMIDQFRAGGRP